MKRRKAVERNESYQMLAANQLTADQLATLQGSDALSAKKQQQFKPKPIKPSEDASSHHGLMSSLADDLETDELDESESFETSDEEEAQEQQPSAPSSSSSS
ncbi:MAG: hypothetical protein Q8P67_27765, partial [archaeon]|nr:hypothetical protein [archaeon]